MSRVLLFLLLLTGPACAQGIPASTRQLVVVMAEGWDSKRGSMQLFERDPRTGAWAPTLQAERPVLLGRSGIAWGRGILPRPLPKNRPTKVEGDGRTPAGVFALGRVFGYDPAPPRGTRLPYHQVTRWDCWVEDIRNPLYNRHVRIDPSKGIPPWHEAERMRMDDHAHSLKLEIRHNSDPPQPGFGSAIFFHIRRGPDRLTAGCTTMKKEDLVHLITWLDPAKTPHLVLLPRPEYLRARAAWQLP